MTANQTVTLYYLPYELKDTAAHEEITIVTVFYHPETVIVRTKKSVMHRPGRKHGDKTIKRADVKAKSYIFSVKSGKLRCYMADGKKLFPKSPVSMANALSNIIMGCRWYNSPNSVGHDHSMRIITDAVMDLCGLSHINPAIQSTVDDHEIVPWQGMELVSMSMMLKAAAFPFFRMLLEQHRKVAETTALEYPSALRDGFHATNLHEFVRILFGKKTTKPLIKAVGAALRDDNWNSISWAYMLKPFVKKEHLPDVIGLSQVFVPGHYSAPRVRRTLRWIFATFSYHRALRMVTSNAHAWANMSQDVTPMLYDMEEMYAPYADQITIPRNLTSLGDLHDWIARENVKFSDGSYPITYPDQITELHGRQLGELTVVLPTETVDLITWGQELNICVGTQNYRDAARSGSSYLIAFSHENKLHSVMEINTRNKTVRQWYTARNGPVNPSYIRPVLNELKARKVLAQNAQWVARGFMGENFAEYAGDQFNDNEEF